MLTLALGLSILALGLLAYLLLVFLGEVQLRIRMQKNERYFEREGVLPAGACLSHGPYISKQTRDLKAGQMKSLAWYKRLI
ncbi:MAG: hypothetical protein IBX50_08555 [Marinospirillum sp.]|uniref:hypothetical protein n=1 Tax=Marinospirillum sp. TaxID=2183934 RepID=UPI001A0D5F81|nr:hypothetical protein [Marinospirillum sp.]MBE0506757.1 hypothetical protein [Marinospirillum sp.]